MVNAREETDVLGAFFDENVEDYGIDMTPSGPSPREAFLIEFIAQNPRKSILDVGCSIGRFIGYLNNLELNMEVTALDPSKRALDRINIENVLHHMADDSIEGSKKMVIDSLKTLTNILTNGFILLVDMFYESYLFPTFTRNVIKTLLNFQNKYHVKISLKDFIYGLDVCFYTREEFRTIFLECNLEIVDYHEWHWNDKKSMKHISLINNWGNICFILKKAPNSTFVTKKLF